MVAGGPTRFGRTGGGYRDGDLRGEKMDPEAGDGALVDALEREGVEMELGAVTLDFVGQRGRRDLAGFKVEQMDFFGQDKGGVHDALDHDEVVDGGWQLEFIGPECGGEGELASEVVHVAFEMEAELGVPEIGEHIPIETLSLFRRENPKSGETLGLVLERGRV